MKLFYIVLISFISTLGATVFSKAFAAGEKVLNRSVLSVGHDFYTSFDAYGVLAAYKFTNDQKLDFRVDWFAVPQFAAVTGDNVFDSIQSYPIDAQDLIFVTFVWNEVKRLNLFEANSKDIEESMKKFRTNGLQHIALHAVREYLSTCSNGTLFHYFEMAHRATTYKRVRGAGQKSRQPSITSWFWHAEKASK